jgi:ribose 5-phosphate isomerase B
MIFLGADHAGYRTKEAIKKYLSKAKIRHMDLGTYSEKPVDYPVYAKRVANAVVKTAGKGILICGTGTGMCIAANKVKGIRAAAAFDEYGAKMSRHDNDTNILCLRGRNFSASKAVSLTKVWLNTPFSNISRHKKRIKKLE